MLRVTVNNINGKYWSSIHEDKDSLDRWLRKHEKLGTFGKKERKVREDKKPKDLEYEEVEKFKFDPNTFELILDEDGIPEVDGVEYIVTYPCEYEIEIKEVTTTQTEEGAWKELRDRRNQILKDTDYTQLPDSPLNQDMKKLYRGYREYLRKLPSNYNDDYILNYKIETFKEWRNRVYPQ